MADRTIAAVEVGHIAIASAEANHTVATWADHIATEVVIVRIVVAAEADHTTVTGVSRTAEVEVINQAVAFQVEVAIPTAVVEAKHQLKVVRSQAAWWEELELEAAVGLGVLQRGL